MLTQEELQKLQEEYFEQYLQAISTNTDLYIARRQLEELVRHSFYAGFFTGVQLHKAREDAIAYFQTNRPVSERRQRKRQPKEPSSESNKD